MTDGVEKLREEKYGYVAGFMFNGACDRVALILKSKPDWQKGLYNAVGGKVEDEDVNHDHAMRREFQEETGVYHIDWRKFCLLDDVRGYKVHFYVAKTNSVYSVKSVEEEPVELIDIRSVDTLKCITNLKWLIPMALTIARGQEDRAMSFHIKEHNFVV